MLNRLNLYKTTILFGLLAALQSVHAATDHWQMNMPRGVTPLSKDMYDLHMICLAVCAVIGVIVFGVMIYSLMYHRKSRGHAPATFSDHKRLEIVWSIIPIIILVALAVPATQMLIRLEDSRHADVTIKVVGSQWKWRYEYLDQGIRFYSILSTPYAQIQNQQPKGEWYLLEVDHPVVVPIQKKIRFLVTSNDVIHSWWVPELGIKRDAIPGFMRESWAWIEKPGVYRGQCAELCGINHGYMPIVVKAVSEAEFKQWVSEQPKVVDPMNTAPPSPVKHPNMSRKALMTLGKAKYDLICAACHNMDGEGIPPLYPALKNSSIAVGVPIARHIDRILTGVPGSAMRPYQEQLTDEEIAAIVTYERNAWDNNTDNLVQPEEVAQQRLANHQPSTSPLKTAHPGRFR